MLGLNFGTGTSEMAGAYVEYCNVERVLMLNRDLDAEREVVLELGGRDPGARPRVRNDHGGGSEGVQQPRRVAPQRLDAPGAARRMMFKLPPRSYTVAQLGLIA